jgi:hypothetical protein
MQIARFLTCLLVGLFAGGGCGDGSNGPSGPSNTVTQVQVGVSGNGSTQLAPGAGGAPRATRPHGCRSTNRRAPAAAQ